MNNIINQARAPDASGVGSSNKKTEFSKVLQRNRGNVNINAKFEKLKQRKRIALRKQMNQIRVDSCSNTTDFKR